VAEAIRIRDLRKRFRLGFIPKTREILKGITFSVREGEIFGYLGPNGAGKTTTIKCLLGLIRPDAGTVEIFGRSHLSPRSREPLGFLPENPYFYDYLSAREFLAFTADLFGLERREKEGRIARLLKLVGLERAADLPLRKYSRGMLQRAGLAQSLINDPKLVILDEPLGGMDPLGRKEIRDIIVRFKDEGKTVFFTSHILQDIEMICDRVAIIVGGRIVKEGDLADRSRGSRGRHSPASARASRPRATGSSSASSMNPRSTRSSTSSGARKAASSPSAPGPRRSRTSSSRR